MIKIQVKPSLRSFVQVSWSILWIDLLWLQMRASSLKDQPIIINRTCYYKNNWNKIWIPGENIQYECTKDPKDTVVAHILDPPLAKERSGSPGLITGPRGTIAVLLKKSVLFGFIVCWNMLNRNAECTLNGAEFLLNDPQRWSACLSVTQRLEAAGHSINK